MGNRGEYGIENIRKNITIVVATKAGSWLMNHHTGQGAMHGYPRKVADITWSNQEMTAANKTLIMHTLGHWAFTLYVLSLTEVEGILPTEPAREG